MNEFKDLEATLKKAFAREKQQGLAPQQLLALHEAIDRGSPEGAKKPRRWWQWSVAGSLLATALVAVVVVDRFPRSQDVMTETAAPLAQKNKKSSKADKEAASPPPAVSLADGRGAVKDKPAESAPAQKISDSGIMARKRESRVENEMAKQVQPKPVARPKVAVNAGPTPNANKAPGKLNPPTGLGKWETKSQLSTDKTPAQMAQPNTLAESSADKAETKADDLGPGKGGVGGFGSAGSGGSAGAAGAALGGASKPSLDLAPETSAPAAPQKTRKKAAGGIEKYRKGAFQIEIVSLAFKGSGSVEEMRKFINSQMAGLQLCYAELRAKNPEAKGDMTLIWQFPVFKIKISADAFANTAMRQCVTNRIGLWVYPAGMTSGNVEATLRFSYD